MIDDPVLVNDWHVVARSCDVHDEWDDPAYRHVLGGPYPIRASAPRVIENFLDATHFPFVHEGILGSRDHTELGSYQVDTGPDGIVAHDIHTWTPNPDGSGEAKMARWLYRVLRPLTAYIGLSVPGGGSEPYTSPKARAGKPSRRLVLGPGATDRVRRGIFRASR